MPGELNSTSAAKGAMIISTSARFQPSSQWRWSIWTVASSSIERSPSQSGAAGAWEVI